MKKLCYTSILVAIIAYMITSSNAADPWANMGVTCELETIPVTVRNEMGCSKSGVIVQYCRGTCRSASQFLLHYPYYKVTCRCCRKIETTRRPVLLTCPDGSVKIKFIEYASRCKCRGCLY
eukprot:Seg1348.8 transcript_id=Seg1348.8/GoldUCD/mRNA.D3Y31 product=Mucin-2 protein_id=Seg1348.8/GoldUCD/D3Y31